MTAAGLLVVKRLSGIRRPAIVTTLPGYRAMGPVRLGNDAYRQIQHDVLFHEAAGADGARIVSPVAGIQHDC